MNNIISVLIVLLLILPFGVAEARGNKPCSGKKDGISHCQGAIFVCNDGSVNQPKKNCSKEYDGSNGISSFGAIND